MPFYRRKKKDSSRDKAVSSRIKITKKPDLKDKLDRVFSKYIRLRDAMDGGYTKCISCGQIKPFESFDCGHYFSRKHMNTRFDEDNAHSECSFCNRMTGGEHMIGYRRNLIIKIGATRFQMLEVKANTCKKWEDFELQLLIDHYKKEAKRLAKEKGISIKI